MDWPRFKKSLKEDWNIEAEDEVKDNALVFRTEGMVVACSLMPNPVPNKEAEECAKNNIMWKDGAAEVAKHQAHVMLAVMNKFDAMEQAVLFAKIAYSLLKLDNAIGIYKNPTVYEKKFYLQFAETLKQGEMPVPILVYTGMYLAKDGLCAFSSGMTFFGKNELEVIDSKQQPDQVLSFMFSIEEYVLTENVELKDGETIGFSEEQKLPISVGDGVSVKGTTCKIGF
ncbi:DUF4261 domain-containing protein [Ruminococcus sp.]|uniref:DUF4261 domain-containing protein n=1 Tax=Ruminococcus sp. TaxID=41978 RepID=UPI0025F7F50B|nr:DUF4261 domain-containing protein [Ruminococcus sp.]